MIRILSLALFILLSPRLVILNPTNIFNIDKNKIIFLNGCYMNEGFKSDSILLNDYDNCGMTGFLTDNQSDFVDGRKFDIEFSLDCLRIPAIAVQANANFTIGYIIRIDDKWHPDYIRLMMFDKATKMVMEGVLNSEEVISCIKKWKFGGLNPKSTYTILLRWEHMKGWVTMMIYSDKMNLYINLLPDKN
jgi:hypothetical protein